MGNAKRIALIGVVPIALAGWYAFRPEKLFINDSINESAPAGSIVARGEFTSDAHETKGEAQIIQANGKPVLRLNGFSTSNGPDVHVILVPGEDASQKEKVVGPGSIDLGSLKANLGSQNYPLPASFEPTKHKAVSIWCKRFSVNFGDAVLEPTS